MHLCTWETPFHFFLDKIVYYYYYLNKEFCIIEDICIMLLLISMNIVL